MANILIIDDSGISRKKLRTILESGNHTVAGEARDGSEGIEQFKALSPDLVTLDVTMPNMDGISCLKSLLEINDDAKVVMISALGKGDVMLEALNLGAVNYITKPFEGELVLNAIADALEED